MSGSNVTTPSQHYYENTKQYFAVFGDIHGRVTLMYTVAMLWQIATGIRLSGILQVGDMGAFPDTLKLDNATKIYSKEDPDELDFSNYCKNTPDANLILSQCNAPPSYFIQGNHEDFQFLNQYNSPATVDPWNKIHFIPNGMSIKLKPSTYIGAFGGIPPIIEKKTRGKTSKKRFKKSQINAENDPRYFTKEFANTAFQNSQRLSILLTHAGPKCIELPEGSAIISDLCEKIKPKIHIFGHHHKVIAPCEGPGDSLMVGLEHFKFNQSLTTIVEGSWGILTLNKLSSEFNFADPKRYSLLNSITSKNYREIIRSVLS